MHCDDDGALGLARKVALDLRGSFPPVARHAQLWTNVVGYELHPGRYLIWHLDAELSEVTDGAPLITDAPDAIAQALSEGAPRTAEVTPGLGLSARSFHRRLSEHGMSFQTLTEDTCRDLAEGLLRDDRHSLAEIAFLPGFSGTEPGA